MRWGVLLVTACGRLGFDERVQVDAAFVESVGQLDPSFGAGGQTILTNATTEVDPRVVLTRGSGYLTVGIHHLPGPGSTHFGLIGIADDGLPDPAFGSGGFLELGPTGDDFGYGALRIDADRLVVVGDGQLAPPATDEFTIGLIDDNGTLDPGFGAAGFLRVDIENANHQDTARSSVRVGADLVTCGVAGYELADTKLALIRYDLSGNLVASFGDGGQVTDDFGTFDECRDLVLVGDRLIAAVNSTAGFLVAAYDSTTGARATDFATGGTLSLGGIGRANGIAIDGDELVVAGARDGDGVVLRLTATGEQIAEVAVPSLDTLAGVVRQPNGKLVVAGDANGAAKVVRLLADGSLDSSFGTGGIVGVPADVPIEVRHLLLDDLGRVVMLGTRMTSPVTGVIARVR